MSDQLAAATAENTRTVVIEQVFAHPPAKLWRALTEPSLIAQWLMSTDFHLATGHKFQFRADPAPNWKGIIESEVLIVEHLKKLSYTWNSSGLESVVLWTLTPAEGGTHLRMEHSGFGPNQDAAYKGATYGWQKFIGNLERIVSEMAELGGIK